MEREAGLHKAPPTMPPYKDVVAAFQGRIAGLEREVARLAAREEVLGRIDFLLSDVQLHVRSNGAETQLQQVMEARNLLREIPAR